MTSATPAVPAMYPQPLMVHTPDLQEGDMLANANGLIVAGPPSTDEDGDGYVLVPLHGHDQPIRFLVTAAWLVVRQ